MKKHRFVNQENVIEVENLSKTFERKIRGKGLKGFFDAKVETYDAVKNISFSIKKGEKVAFVGPNGAGKSTTIKMLTGIIHPTDGKIKVAGYNPVTQRKQMAYKIGCMFGQKSGLWMHLTAMDSYKLFGAIYDLDEKEALKKINNLIDTFQINDLVNIPVRKLSLGQRMICEIVGVLIHEPEIIFLDEPTIGLDIVVKERLRNLIKAINEKNNVTVFLTSHDVGDIEKLCDRVIIIDKGQIVIDEDIKKLKEKYMKTETITIRKEESVALEDIIYDIYTH
ncbi:MAG: ATP-binding cassette domain-containing protein [Clostridia bacterium]|nr:ATP-binding cassette domain-containing protein [Clostridia bacterium]